MASLNETLIDDAIAHAILLERYKASVSRQILGYLNERVLPKLVATLESRLSRIATRGFDAGALTTQRYKDMIEGLTKIVKVGSAGGYEAMKGELGPFGKSEADWMASRLNRWLNPVGIDLTIPSAQLLRSIVTSRPFQGRFLRDEWKDWDASTRSKVTDAIRHGLTTGETVDQMVRRIRGTKAAGFADGVLQASRHQAAGIVRTAVNAVSTNARQALFEDNQDVVDRVEWVSTLDTKTSEICAALDGKTFPVNSGPRPPAHRNCRSTIVPVVKSWKELGIDGLKPFPGGERHARAVFDGKVPASMKFPEWWKKLSVEEQNRQFGVGKATLLRQGRITFSQLIDQRLRPLTLQELEAIASGSIPKPKPRPRPQPKPKPPTQPADPIGDILARIKTAPLPASARGSEIRVALDDAFSSVLPTVDSMHKRLESLSKELAELSFKISTSPSAQAARLREQRRIMMDEKDKLGVDLIRLKEGLARKARELFKYTGATTEVSLGEAFDTLAGEQLRNSASQAVEFVNSILAKASGRESLTVGLRLHDGYVRESADVNRSSLNLHEKSFVRTIVHELGHIIESSPGPGRDRWLRRTSEFLDKRAARDKDGLRSLRDIVGDPSFRADEMAWKDDFLSPYMGKNYIHNNERYATELVSMGIQHLYDDPFSLAYGDPAMFDWILDMLRGHL